MNRRKFAKTVAVASVAATAGLYANIPDMSEAVQRNRRKGIMWESIGIGETILEKFRCAKDAGFDGVEVMSHLDRAETLKASEITGMPIASVCGALHWQYPVCDPKPEVREQGIAALTVALEDAAAYSTDTVLFVPGRVNETVSYDECWDRTAEALKKVIPLAEKLQIKIAIENVWNNFLLSPIEAAIFVDSFKSPMVAFYFDCGNILPYGFPEQWIKILNKRIARVHIKEYSNRIANTQGKSAGFNVKLTEGDVDWSAVMKTLDDINYDSWTTIEQPGGNTPEGLADLCNRLKIIQSS